MLWEPLLWAMAVLGFLAFGAAIAAVAMAFRFRRAILAERVWDRTAFFPQLLVLVPVRGASDTLEADLSAILSQDYPSYRVVFCLDGLDDPAATVIERVRARRAVPTDLAFATLAEDVGGKARALLGGLRALRPADEVVAFLDADIRPAPGFLRALAQPLAHPRVGATTGYRWYVPVEGGLWSAVRSAWNAAGLNLFFSERYNFLWGGGWAARREILDRLDLRALWRGTLSEDLAVTERIKAMGLRIRFVPPAVAPTFEDCDRHACLEWTTRQTAMVAVWGRHIRNFAALTYGVFDGAFLLGLLCIGLALAASPWFLVPALLFLSDIPVAIANGEHRCRSVFLGSPNLESAWRVSRGRWALANLVVPWLIAWNLLRTRRVRTIEWRGRTYEIAGNSIRAP